MADYKAAHDQLDTALRLVEPDGPEWIKIKAAMAALDEAELARIEKNFATVSSKLDDATAKLRALVQGLQVNGPSTLINQLNAGLALITPLAQEASDLLGGEPATAIAGTAFENKVSFPAPQPSVPPLREFARDLAQPAAAAAAAAGAAPGPESVQGMIDDILRREGGFTDNPADKGGPTNFGITLRTLTTWRSPKPVTRDDVRTLTAAQAREIYATNYYSGPHIDQLPALLQPVMFDMAVNHGPGTAVRLLQNVLCKASYNCSVDGGIGPETKEAATQAAKALGKQLVNDLVAARRALYQDIAARDPSQKVFLVGWLKRADEFTA